MNMSAQVNGYIFESRDAFCRFSQLRLISDSLFILSMPPVNVDSLLAEDAKQTGWGPFRFGYAMDVDYTIDNGKWTQEGDRRIWCLRFYSKGAYSINFGFSEMELPTDAEMYIFSTYGYEVYGPVTAYQNIQKGVFNTGPTAGCDVMIQLIEPAASKETSKLRISQVVHGYKNTYSSIFTDPDKVPASTPCVSADSYIDTSNAVAGRSSCRVFSGTGKQVIVTFTHGAGTAPRPVAWSLHTVSGALAATGRIDAQGGTLNFGKLPDGVYVLTLDTESGTPESHKIVLK
jgi:hypothetical protein